jgi:bacterioferritin-associated ferredoxin
MILCLCRGVSESTVHTAIGAGAQTLDDVADACAAGSDCGACQDMIDELLTCARRRRLTPPLPSASEPVPA